MTVRKVLVSLLAPKQLALQYRWQRWNSGFA